MGAQTKRIGAIIKLIANNPGVKLSGLREKLLEAGYSVTERTVSNDIEQIKTEYQLLPHKERLRSGYFLYGMKAVGEEEIGIVVDALSAFGVNLSDKKALEIARRLAISVVPRVGLRQRDIYQAATSQTEIGELLLTAMRGAYAAELAIDSPHRMETLKIRTYPLFRVFHERGWYLITRNLEADSYHPCRMDRIRSCEILRQEPRNTSVDAQISQAQFLINAGWGMDFPHSIDELEEAEARPEIIVRFDQSIARFIREGVNRHPKAVIVPAPDGSGCVDFKIKLKYHNEFKHWVRSWGSKAWFIAPQNFIDDQVAEIRRQMSIYKINA